MTAFDRLAHIDAEIRAGATTLLDVLDYLRINRLDTFSRAQMEAATAVNDAEPEPEPIAAPAPPVTRKPVPVKRRRARA